MTATRGCPCGVCSRSRWRVRPDTGAPGCIAGQTAWTGSPPRAHAAAGSYGTCGTSGSTGRTSLWRASCCCGSAKRRLRQRGDEHALFQLYKAAVPANVRAAEAMTLEEWAALHKGTKRWTPGPLDDRRQHVWQDGEAALAWMELTGNAKS